MSSDVSAKAVGAALAALIATAGAGLLATPGQSAPAQAAAAPSPGKAATDITARRALVTRYCVGCHNVRSKAGELALDGVDLSHVADNPETWERVVRKLRAGLMPPAGRPRPDQATYDEFRGWLQGELDRASVEHPDPGRTEVFHRLNRVEYRNAVRDLLHLDVDIANLLPADDGSYGFDNIAGVLRVSPSLLERYLDTAKEVSRLAVSSASAGVNRNSYHQVSDAEQYDRGEDLPLGTRGGMLIHQLFSQDGEYEIVLDVAGSVREPDQLEVAIDGQQVSLIALEPNKRLGKVTLRVPIKAGARAVGVTFYKRSLNLVEGAREPMPNPGVVGNTPPGGLMAYLTDVTIAGPFNAQGAGETPSRQRIFRCRPASVADEMPCAKRILSTLARRAYRGTPTNASVQVLLDFYKQGRTESGRFDGGIEFALRRLLVEPQFLFRVEADPPARAEHASGSHTYRLNSLQLASRLSFFLWSSIPDDALLDVAEQGRLEDPSVLEHQVKRMLMDPRSSALTENFAAQWLLLRNIPNLKPADPYSRAFDATLGQSFQRETELFFDSVVRENRSVMDLLTANYTFLNERLASHYQIPNVQGSQFRRVELPADSPRRGLLGQGSILTLTSNPVRTSPVLRGKYVLNAILGTPPPDPPPNVPALVDKPTQAKVQTMRQRMAQHRSNPLCANCHSMIDPAGFALENFDPIGRWRTVDESYNPIDASGTLPDGTKFSGLAEFRAALVARPERFANTVSEKLLTYALGRGLEYYDMPAVRRIVRDAAADNYRFQTVILGVVKSYPFMSRRTSVPAQMTSASR